MFSLHFHNTRFRCTHFQNYYTRFHNTRFPVTHIFIATHVFILSWQHTFSLHTFSDVKHMFSIHTFSPDFITYILYRCNTCFHYTRSDVNTCFQCNRRFQIHVFSLHTFSHIQHTFTTHTFSYVFITHVLKYTTHVSIHTF